MLVRQLTASALLALTMLVSPGCSGEPSEPPPRAEGSSSERSGKATKQGKAGKRASSERIKRGNVHAPKTVVFVVLDTVRADHTSLCGYERPTTPVLEEMVERGAVHTCRAYSPAPWTHPSHASFFTGKSVVEHHAVWVSDSAVSINPVTRVRPLEDTHVTLAEQFRDAGYQTAAISANMIVTEATGLLQGFDKTLVAEHALALRGDRFVKELKKGLRELKKKEPLFLFLNFYDAHDPYPSIPKGQSWVPKQAMENLHPNQHDKKHPYYRFVKGLSEPAAEAKFLQRVTNGYDWGIHQADAGLGEVMQHLIDEGWTDEGLRIVVTSDHGELLGEHRLLRHGGFVYEPVLNVPLVYFDSTADKQPDLPEPSSGIWVHDLLLRGRIPSGGPPVHAVSEPNENDILIGSLSGAVWSGDDKLVCTDGERGRFDLATDPGELQRQPLAGHAMAPALKDLCNKVDTMFALPVPEDDPNLIEALKAVGYME